jgi:arylsulfatase A-like enzyme
MRATPTKIFTGRRKKQRPWDESVRVPFLIKPASHFIPRTSPAPIDAPDVMPTLLGLTGIDAPNTVEGYDLSAHLLNDAPDPS